MHVSSIWSKGPSTIVQPGQSSKIFPNSIYYSQVPKQVLKSQAAQRRGMIEHNPPPELKVKLMAHLQRAVVHYLTEGIPKGTCSVSKPACLLYTERGKLQHDDCRILQSAHLRSCHLIILRECRGGNV